ncbi:hypothetical protein NDI85_19800 [Halomicroarcula sp. S1AR25-4]|uniref:hypothetical protein n=1 Tax=Haloarcula sp. S1AR25-4 TaxID=2950538 RepID=UPI0028747E14|nr:hypothetical protein [Halomicroarcula sp. S1AR25-4]MDS0280033.1 hypothetical protein [Halomicroarcula sp. S1AR25-4]
MLTRSGDGDMTRALLTDGERAAIRGDEMDDGTRSSHRSRVKRKLENRMGEDARLLRRHEPELFELLHESVCEKEYDERIAQLEARIDELETRLEDEPENSDDS